MIPLARDLDSYPPLPYRGEDMRNVIRLEDCACGGRIVQLVGQDPAAVVQAHVNAYTHREWSLRTRER